MAIDPFDLDNQIIDFRPVARRSHIGLKIERQNAPALTKAFTGSADIPKPCHGELHHP